MHAMKLIYYAFVMVFFSPTMTEHIENYYIEYLANHYSEYENQTKTQDNATAPTSRLLKNSVGDNYYHLYTRSNPDSSDLLFYNDISSVNSSEFDPSLPIVVVVHGWGGDYNSDINPAIIDAYLNKSSVNVIVVDWNQEARKNYVSAVSSVPSVGRNLGRFLAYLSTATGASFTQMHLLGFSLGAHVIGNAGRYLGGRVARITGLDPAGPLWTLNVNCLKSTDANYVEAIHTNRGVLGIILNVGDTDFYPNGGNIQPGCSSPSCNHSRSWKLFIASLQYNHLKGRKCGSAMEADFNNCHGDSLLFGNDDLHKAGIGMYAFSTTSTYPY